MSTIGIFGDSFADPSHGHEADQNLRSEAWVYKLDQEVEIHAKGGSSLYYSYSKFLQNHEKYDKNIFIVTSLTRIPFEITPFTKEKSWMLSCGSGNSARDHLRLNHLTTSENRKICQAIADWYDYLMPHFPFYDYGQLIYNEIKRLRPDTVFIPMLYSKPGRNYDLNIPGPTMSDYASLVVNSLKPAEYSGRDSWLRVYTEIPEKRTVCHFTKEVNDLVATHVVSALETGIWNPVLPAYVEHEYPFEYYFEITKKGHWFSNPKLG
jgi:hypothetical protein